MEKPNLSGSNDMNLKDAKVVRQCLSGIRLAMKPQAAVANPVHLVLYRAELLNLIRL